MPGISRRHSHFVYGLIQSGLTCAITAAITSFPFMTSGNFASHWLKSWVLSWLLMLPVVLFTAPIISRPTYAVTREE